MSLKKILKTGARNTLAIALLPLLFITSYGQELNKELYTKGIAKSELFKTAFSQKTKYMPKLDEDVTIEFRATNPQNDFSKKDSNYVSINFKQKNHSVKFIDEKDENGKMNCDSIFERVEIDEVAYDLKSKEEKEFFTELANRWIEYTLPKKLNHLIQTKNINSLEKLCSFQDQKVSKIQFDTLGLNISLIRNEQFPNYVEEFFENFEPQMNGIVIGKPIIEYDSSAVQGNFEMLEKLFAGPKYVAEMLTTPDSAKLPQLPEKSWIYFFASKINNSNSKDSYFVTLGFKDQTGKKFIEFSDREGRIIEKRKSCDGSFESICVNKINYKCYGKANEKLISKISKKFVKKYVTEELKDMYNRFEKDYIKQGLYFRSNYLEDVERFGITLLSKEDLMINDTYFFIDGSLNRIRFTSDDQEYKISLFIERDKIGLPKYVNNYLDKMGELVSTLIHDQIKREYLIRGGNLDKSLTLKGLLDQKNLYYYGKRNSGQK